MDLLATEGVPKAGATGGGAAGAGAVGVGAVGELLQAAVNGEARGTRRARQRVMGVVGALVAAGLVLGLRALLDPWLGSRVIYSLAMPAVLALALVSGWRTAVLCAVVSFVGGLYLFEEPRGSLLFPTAPTMVNLLAAAVNTALTIGVAQAYHVAKERSEERGEETRRIARALWLAEEEYRLAFEDDIVGRASFEPGTCRLLRANRRFAELAGFGAEQPATVEARDLIHPEDDGALEAVCGAAAGRGPCDDVRCRLRRGDGSVVWVSLSATLVRTSRDEMGRLLVTVRDITAQRETELRLRRDEARFAALFGHTSVGVAELDPDGVIRLVNARFCEMVGRTQEELLGVSMAEITDPEDLPRALEMRDELGGAESSFVIEKRYVRPDGTRVWASASVAAVLDDAGKPWRIMVVAQDITDRKRWETMLARRGEELEELVERRTAELTEAQRRQQLSERMAAIGVIASGLAHDIRNLLIPLRSRLEVLESRGLPARSLQDVNALRHVADHMQHLTAGLRLLALDPHGASVGDATELGAWAVDAEPVLRLVLPPTVSLVSNLPAGMGSAQIGAPALTQAVLNLVQNAGDALAGRPDGKVTVWAEHGAEGRIRVGVSDNGPGMSEEVLGCISEPMFTTKEHGTGLGLAIVREIVARSGGSVQIESRVGEGTTVVLDLPAAAENEEHERGLRAVVDLEDGRIAAVLAAVLEGLHVAVVPAEEGADAQLLITDQRSGAHRRAWRSGACDVTASRVALVLDDMLADVVADRVLVLGRSPGIGVVRRTVIDAVALCRARAAA